MPGRSGIDLLSELKPRLPVLVLSVQPEKHYVHLSSKTVSTYRTRMLDKLGVSSDAEVMRYAHARHIV